MFVFYGVGTYISKKSPVKIYRDCSDCGAHNSLSVIPVFKYAHIFWLPFCYAGKDYILHCDSCGLHYQGGGIKVDKSVSRNIKPPLWLFSGLAILILFIGFLVWEGKTAPERNRKQVLEAIANPQKGDIYEVKFDEKEYGLYKLDRVEGDSIFFLVHDYAVAKDYEAKQLGKGAHADSYSMEIGYTKNEFNAIIDEGYILKVRK